MAAAAVSDLPETARQRLTAIQRERDAEVFDAFDATLGDARAHSLAVDPMVWKYGPALDRRDNLDLAGDLLTREASLAAGVLAARRAQTQGSLDPDETRILHERVLAAGAARSLRMGRLAVALADLSTQSVAMAGLRSALYGDSFTGGLGTELATNFAGFAALRGLAHALPRLGVGKQLATLKQADDARKYAAHGAELTIEAATRPACSTPSPRVRACCATGDGSTKRSSSAWPSRAWACSSATRSPIASPRP